MDQTDEHIVSQVQAGDVESFGVLMQRYEDRLTRYARRFFFDVDESRDIVQEVFIKTYTNINSFDSVRRFSPWIYRIAHNEIINALKKKTGKITIPMFDFDTFLPHLITKDTLETDVERKQTREFLESSLQKLDVKYREVMTLYYFEDMEYGEIADILKIPVSTVGVRLSRGKAFLKKIIGQSLSL